MKIASHGLTVQSATPVDARIFQRQAMDGETTHPVVQISTTSMPDSTGDYGSGAVDVLGPNDVFLTLVEFGAAEVASPLFATKGLPKTLNPNDFSRDALQRVQKGQSGMQFWFSEAGRAFCLYIVLGSHANRRRLMPKATAMVQSLQIGPN